MERRDFVKSLTAVGLSAAAISSALPFSALASVGNTSGVNVKQLFNQALIDNEALIGFASIDEDFAPKQLEIEGKVPADLTGMFVRNGPAKHERGEQRYRHLFEGDGMVQKFNIADGKISHQGKFLNTPKFSQEQSADRFLFSGPDTKLNNALPISSVDQVNTANTNVIAVNDELWALWEGGSATSINRDDLSYQGQVNLGDGNHYGNKLKGMPFSAHPKVDPNGDIWNFGLHPSGHVVVYHLSARGKLMKLNLVDTGYKGGMLHDFLITQNHVLLILPSLVRDRSKEGLFNSISFDKALPMRVLVLDKNTLKPTKQYELPPAFVFHFGNAWQNANGDITFDASIYQDIGVLHELADVMVGKQVAQPSLAHTTLFTLHKNGAVSQKKFDEISDFPRVCEHLTGLQNRYLFHLSSNKTSLWSNSVVARDLNNDRIDQYKFGNEYLVEEHVPICPTGKEGVGYLIGTALHVPSKRTCLNIFNMAKVADGPIARAWLPYHLPLGFHGNFIAS